MRFTQIILAAGFLFAAAQSFGHGKGGGPCSTYEAACKADTTIPAGDKKARWKCVGEKAAADGDKGKACTDMQAKFKDHAKAGGAEKTGE